MNAAPLWALLACAGHPPPATPAQPPAASDRASRPDPVVPPVPAADPAAGRADLIYFVLVDRFANGDPSNDTASPGPPVDRSDPQGWHGGDLRGVIDHLDHISGLGTTRLWLSPVFRTRTEPIGEWGAYHGYWQWDPTTVEPRFGTRAELVELAEALRSRRMGLLLDLVTNHVGYDAPVLQAHPDWFHDTPSIEDWQDPVQLEQWRVHGLPDIDQDHPEAAAWLTNAALGWQALLHPTGFRVDAVRHVPNEFLARLGARLGAGHPTWWLGEDFQGSPPALAESQRTGGFTHVFDFPLYYAMTEVFCDRASPSRIASVLYQDRLYDRPQGLVTFLDNHDLPRIASRCHEDPGAVRRALLFLLATRGVPALTWGTEVGLTGAEEPENRADMRFDGDIYGRMIRRLMVERTDHPSLRVGRQRVIALGPEHVAIARVHDDDAAVIGVNIGSEPVALPLPPPLAEGDPVRRMTVQRESPLVIDSPGPPGDPRVLPGHSVRAWVFAGDFDDFEAEGPQAPVTIHATGVAPGSALRLVGSNPELGGWDPAHAIPLTHGPDGWTATLTMPAGAVLEGKLVVVEGSGPDGSGAVRWSPHPNRAFLVPAGGGRWEVPW